MSRLVAPGLSIPSLAGPHRQTWSESNLSEAKEELIEPIGSRLQDLQLQHAHIEVSKGPGPVDGSVGSDGTDVRHFDVTNALRSGASPSSASRDPRDPRDRDGLGGALLTFGAPSEWWHDSIILGRLSALALRYFASKATQKPWRAWLQHVQRAREKHRLGLRSQLQLALRRWHRNCVRYGSRMQNKFPLVLALQKIVQSNLAPAWSRYRQAVFLQRDVDRRLRLLHIIRWKMMNTMAQVHYCQTLQRLGLAGLWLAAKSKDVTSASPSPANSPEVWSSYSTAKSHLQQVVSRAWRKWWFATRMWLTSAQYRERELEAWLAGECSTPRSMVVAEAFGPENAPFALDTLITTPTSTTLPKDFPMSTRLSHFSLEGTGIPPFQDNQPLVLQHAVKEEVGSLPRVSMTSPFKSRLQRNPEEASFRGPGRSRSYSGRRVAPAVDGSHLDDSLALRHDSLVSDEEIHFVNVGLSTDSTGRDSKIGLLPSHAGSPMPDSPGNNYWAMRRSISRPSVLGTRCR